MTVSNTNQKMTYTGNGVASVFAYTFKIFANTDLVVTKVTIATEAEVTLVLTTDYTVSGAGDPNGGNVTLVAGALASTFKLVIRRVLPLTQGADYIANDSFPAETHESALDKLVMICQQLKEEVDRSVKVGLTGTIVTQEQLTTQVNQAIASAAAAAASATAAASSASSAATQASNAAASAAAAAASATAAAASATTAAAAAQTVVNNMLDTDGTLAANSDSKIATQKATKTYVDGKVVALGSWVSKSFDTVYQAATDGHVVCYISVDNGDRFQLLTDSSNPPGTVRGELETGSGTTAFRGSMSSPVKKNDYYKVAIVSGAVGTSAMYFIPQGA